MHVLDLRAPGPDHERWRRLCARSAGLEGHADAAAREVIAAVRDRGDAAVAELTLRFEGRSIERFELDPGERQAACEAIPADLRAALQLAADNIRRFHATQLPRDTGLHTDDARLVTRARPLQRVAVYAPGGTAAYPSSVLMTA
ncbi:MAG: histidinol dehydrogenase, partial [Myxococcales bacterium]|nr:histidinol dehydrogenase [Myxococcales bacterium]